MKSVALHNLGCKVNAYEYDCLQQKLQENGYILVPFVDHADIYIVNTCTVTNIADRKSRQMLHKAKRRNPEGVVVAVGCYVQTGKEEALKDACIDLAIGNNRKKDLIPILEEFLKNREADNKRKTHLPATVLDSNHMAEYEEMQLKQTGGHTRACIKIQDGCNQFCAYCIIPFARGRVRSRKQERVISEISRLAEAGCREIVLTGIHLSSYGLDFTAGGQAREAEEDYIPVQTKQTGAGDLAHKRGYLISLIEEIARVKGVERIRLGSLEPRIITEEFVRRLGAIPQICPHFHLSLQSGCDATLKRMNRHYLAGEYLEKVELLRNSFTNPAVTTDVIAGFPGETQEEFEQSMAFLEKVCLYEMHVFKYSKRNGTAAATMPDQVADKTKAERSEALLALEKEQSRAYRSFYIGKEIEVLIEEKKVIDGITYQTGYTKTYVKAALRTAENRSNTIVRGIATEFLTDTILLFKEN